MSTKKRALLASMMALAAVSETERNSIYEFTNPYAGLEGLSYSGNSHKGYSKLPLTKKQKKSRAKSKLAKKSRKQNRNK